MINLSKIRPTATVKLLNSTPLGQVMGERQASRHLQKAGYRIAGDANAKTINLLKYAAWLIDEVKDGNAAQIPEKRSYDEIKEAARARAAAASASGRDIGKLPPVKNPKRRKACSKNLQLFLKTYFPKTFELPWSKNHFTMIRKIETAIFTGGLFADAEPRATGKTSIAERGSMFGAFHGYRKFIALIGDTAEAALDILNVIKLQIETNDLLLEDFPEICYPIRCLEGITNRCNGQLCEGVRTRITWNDDEIVLPTIPGSAASGVRIVVRGITGRIRGMKASTAFGENLRPDLVIIDDPQNDESAASPEQIKKRLKILSGAILGLAGPGKKIAGIMPCTVIQPGDVADQILDPQKHPEWNGERNKLLPSFPKNMELWEQYREIWGASQRKYGDIREATEFYRMNQAEMDEGAESSWPERFEDDEISGIQYAMNIYIRDPDVFYAEYQNDPRLEIEEDIERITVEQVLAKLNNRPRGEVPQEANLLTAFIDVQKNLLFWKVMAFADDFTSWCIDYGTFPEQQKKVFSLAKANPTYPQKYPGHGLEAAIYAAIRDLANDLLQRDWIREDGAAMRIERCAVDSGWGLSTKMVYRVCRESVHSAILIPSKGMGISAAQKPMSEYKKNFGDKIGTDWMIPCARRKTAKRYLLYDTNAWKSFFRERLFTAPGDPGSFTIFGSNPKEHELLTEHLTSEYSVPTSGRGRKVDIWKPEPKRENHWFDCGVGCMVAASERGCKLLPEEDYKSRKPTSTSNKPRKFTANSRVHSPRR